MTARRFPPPWSVEKQETCFAVRDHNGQQLAYVYFEDGPDRRSAAKLLTRDEARRLGWKRYVRQFLAGLRLPIVVIKAARKYAHDVQPGRLQ